MLHTAKPPPLVEFSHSNITPAMGPESLVGFLTILIYWRGGAGSEARCVIVPLQLVEPLFELGFFRSYFLIEFKSHCFMKFP